MVLDYESAEEGGIKFGKEGKDETHIYLDGARLRGA